MKVFDKEYKRMAINRVKEGNNSFAKVAKELDMLTFI